MIPSPNSPVSINGNLQAGVQLSSLLQSYKDEIAKPLTSLGEPEV